MGTYTELAVNGYDLISSKSAVIPAIMTIFREGDRKEVRRTRGADSGSGLKTIVRYQCSAAKIIDRLEVMGFTLERAKAEFEAGLHDEINRWEEAESDWRPKELPLLKRLTFGSYMRAFGKVIADNLHYYDREKKAKLDPTRRYILDDYDDNWYGFLVDDVRLLVRVACQVVPASSLVVQDITNLIDSGYYTASERVCENVTKALLAQHPENSSRIILTEGSNDVHVLRAGLELLYPHLVGYYSFLDFDSSRAQGGASQLVSLIKAFAGAGVGNRTIAIFDNDTAAREALRGLEAVSLPPNIVVLHYPDIPLLKRYPTIGPSGLDPLDVNGLAGSIELYFGKDVLKIGNRLMPVQWRGYSEGIKQYQGEVTQKSKLMAAYNDRVAQCRKKSALIAKTDWSGIDAILQTIFHAFDVKPKRGRVRRAK